MSTMFPCPLSPFLLLSSLLVSLPLTISISVPSSSFSEELLLSPIWSSSSLLAHFRFTTVEEEGQEDDRDGEKIHFDLFPRALAELAQEEGLQEMEVSLSRGVWREEIWGMAPETAPTGAEVKAWFKQRGKNQTEIDEAWTRVTNALSGQLCASLNFLDSTRTVSPKYSFQPSGVSPLVHEGDPPSTSNFRMGSLPGENVCTENLTPWKKLLPCGSKRGLSTLLNAVQVHKAKYHSLGLKLRRICPGGGKSCAKTQLELVQTLTLVLDPSPHQDGKPVSWSIRSLFGLGLTSHCPMAKETSNVYVDLTQGLFSVQPEPKNTVERDGRTIAIYPLREILDKGIGNIIINFHKETIYGLIKPPYIHATRYVIGHGQEKGGIVTKIVNNGPKPLNVVFLDVVPWFLRLYLHTLKITNNKIADVKPLISDFVPGQDRMRPYTLELVLELPASSETQVSINFEKSILKWLEYPPDANHGFYVGSAVISAVLPGRRNFTSVPRHKSSFSDHFMDEDVTENDKDTFYRLYTETLLINLPTPDFSMPYNVICLACTVVALAFGPLHNITTKRLVLEDKKSEKKGFIKRTWDNIKSKFARKAPKEEANAASEQIREENASTIE